MILPLWLVSLILGIVEGLTEFIPVSSTGHLIIADHFLGFKEMLKSPDKAELFEIVIQLGAILAVGYLYRRDLFNALKVRLGDTTSVYGKLRLHLLAAFLPVAIIGFLFHSLITTYLFSPLTVSISLIIGGIIIIYIESMISVERQKTEIKTMTMRDALIVGFSQILSLIPGTSRSAATIMGGMAGGMTRPAATEFSFLLSFPVMIAATVYDLFKHRADLTPDMTQIIALGFVVSFIVALIVVRWLIRYVRSHSFTGFGYYRIVFGGLILILWLQGWIK